MSAEATIRQAERRCWVAQADGEDGPLGWDDPEVGVDHFGSKAEVYAYVSAALRQARAYGDTEVKWVTELRPVQEAKPCWRAPACAVCGKHPWSDADCGGHFETAEDIRQVARDIDLEVVEWPDGKWTHDGACAVTYSRTAPAAVSPECRDGKHAACVGEAWDDLADEQADCGCTCGHTGQTS